MDTQKFVGLLVFFLVGALVLVAFVPVIQETTSATNTFTNDGYYKMSKLNATDTGYTLSWTSTDNQYVTVNGVDVEIPWNTTYPSTIIALENYGVRYTVVSQSQGTVSLDLFGPQTGVIASKNYDAQITLSGGTMTLSSTGSQDITVEYTTAYVIDPNGSYVMKKSTDVAYVFGDSEIFATGRTSTSFGWININVTGTVDDGFTATVFSDDTVTTSNYVVTSSEVSTYNDLYTFTGVSFDVTKDDDSSTTTYSQVIVPYEVTAEKEYHPDSTLATVINLLPLIAGVGLLMFLVAEFLYTRYL